MWWIFLWLIHSYQASKDETERKKFSFSSQNTRLKDWYFNPDWNKPLVEHCYEYQACCVLPSNVLPRSLLTCCVLPDGPIATDSWKYSSVSKFFCLIREYQASKHETEKKKFSFLSRNTRLKDWYSESHLKSWISLSLNTIMNTRPAVCYPSICYPALCWPAVCYPIVAGSWKYSSVSNISLVDIWIPGLEA